MNRNKQQQTTTNDSPGQATMNKKQKPKHAETNESKQPTANNH